MCNFCRINALCNIRMRRFETIHKTPYTDLLRSGRFRSNSEGRMANVEDLQPAVSGFLSELRNACTSVPELDFTIDWETMSSNTLAYTYTYFTPSSGGVYVPANRFEVYFNPNVPWWNGTCNEIPSGHFDLKTAVMHEVLHGVGFLSTIGSDKVAFPTNYDILLKSASGLSLVSSSGTYKGEMGQPIYIRDLRVYNPQYFEPGSSFSHVNQPSRLMSWSQSACQQHLDFDSKLILNELGYDCLPGVRVTTGNNGGGDGSGMLIGIAIGVVALIGIVIGAISCTKNTKRKKEIEKPLLEQDSKAKDISLQF